MGTLSDMMGSDVSSVFLNTDDFAESIYRKAAGRRQQDSVTCLVTWDKPQTQGDLGQFSFVETGTLTVAPGDWAATDTWFIGDRTYRVTSVSAPQYGTQEITITRKATSDRTTALGIQ